MHAVPETANVWIQQMAPGIDAIAQKVMKGTLIFMVDLVVALDI